MTNPFEDPDGTYLVLINGEGQHSLWPAFAAVPAGWQIAHPADTRAAALGYITEAARALHDPAVAGSTPAPGGP